MLQSEKYAVDMLDRMDIYSAKKRKKPNKNARMNVLEAVENKTLESHRRGPEFESLCAHKKGDFASHGRQLRLIISN